MQPKAKAACITTCFKPHAVAGHAAHGQMHMDVVREPCSSSLRSPGDSGPRADDAPRSWATDCTECPITGPCPAGKNPCPLTYTGLARPSRCCEAPVSCLSKANPLKVPAAQHNRWTCPFTQLIHQPAALGLDKVVRSTGSLDLPEMISVSRDTASSRLSLEPAAVTRHGSELWSICRPRKPMADTQEAQVTSLPVAGFTETGGTHMAISAVSDVISCPAVT